MKQVKYYCDSCGQEENKVSVLEVRIDTLEMALDSRNQAIASLRQQRGKLDDALKQAQAVQRVLAKDNWRFEDDVDEVIEWAKEQVKEQDK